MREYNPVSWEGGEGDPADFESWGCMPFWTSEEAAELSEGLEPGSTGHLREGNLILARITRRQKHIERAIAVGQLVGQLGQIAPLDFVRWAQEQSVELPRALRSAVQRNQEVAVVQNGKERSVSATAAATSIAQCGDEADDVPLATRRKRNFFRLILVMAIEKYRYKGAERSSAARRISEDLQKHGFSLTDDGVRDYLTEAIKELDYNFRIN